MKCACHPNCGAGTALLISKKTKKWAPLPEVFNVERFFDDARTITDAARGPFLTKVQTALSVLRNYRVRQAPEGFRLLDLIRKFDKQSGGALGGVGMPPDGNRKYNTGVGWRYIVEKMHQTATVAEWYKQHGKHTVYANPRKAVPLSPLTQPIALSIPKHGLLIPVSLVSLKKTPQGAGTGAIAPSSAATPTN